MNTSIQITKVDSQKHEKHDSCKIIANGDNADEQDQESLARIVLSGSVIYGTNPRNRLFERFTSNTYAMTLRIDAQQNDDVNNFFDPKVAAVDNDTVDKVAVYTTCKSSNMLTKVAHNMKIPIIRKGSDLTSASYKGEDIDISYSIETSLEAFAVFIVNIGIYVLDQQVVLYGPIGDGFKYRNSTYPIVVNLQPSQTQPYSFWVEYGPN
ncbi:unnamed protein product [Mucor hiemalis]